MWHLGMLFTGGLGTLVAGLNDFKGIFQLNSSMILCPGLRNHREHEGSNANKGQHQLQRPEHSKIFDSKHT